MPTKFRLMLYCVIATIHMGCTSWPNAGKGGFAEHQLDVFIPVEHNQELNYQHGLRFDYELSQHQLDYLITQGADLCFPALVNTARQQEKRVIRELAAQMFADAANNIIILRTQINQLDQQLEHVTLKGACQPNSRMYAAHRHPLDNLDEHTANKDLLTTNGHGGFSSYDNLIMYLEELLNSDNQFAPSSFELNPKYVVRLSRAAQILREYDNLDITITGHTDNHGDDTSNQQLSVQRSNQVAKYLQMMGVQNRRLSTSGIGQRKPLFDGDADHVRLVNRRVTIKVHKVVPTNDTKHTTTNEG